MQNRTMSVSDTVSKIRIKVVKDTDPETHASLARAKKLFLLYFAVNIASQNPSKLSIFTYLPIENITIIVFFSFEILS